jgi:hypothetical protein
LNDERLWIGMTPAITGSCSNATWHTGSNTTGLRDLSRIPPFTVHLMRHAAAHCNAPSPTGVRTVCGPRQATARSLQKRLVHARGGVRRRGGTH